MSNLGHRRFIQQIVGNESYLEIGVREGDSLEAAVSGKAVPVVACCDTWGSMHGGTGRGSHSHIEALLDRIGFEGERIWLDGDSKKLLPPLERTFSVVHVDGDHSYDGAFEDITNAWRLAERVVIVHDLAFSGVHRAIETFTSLTPCPVAVDVGDTGTIALFKRKESRCSGKES